MKPTDLSTWGVPHDGVCRTCATTLSRRNRTGYCRKCVGAALHRKPGFKEKLRAGIKRKIYADPEYADALRKRARAASASPKAVKARTERWHRDRVWEQGTAAQTPEVRARAGRSTTATRLAWCPPHLRETYRDLINSKRIKAAEARRMIEEQEAAELARWRRANGIEEVAAA